jgi:MFS family permease
MIPASLALIGAAFSGEARGRAVGTWAAAGAITSALGPLAGGWLVDVVGWRPIFLVNLPIALLAGVLAWRHVEESRTRDAQPLDVGGALLATAGLAALTLGLTVLAGQHGDAGAGRDPTSGAPSPTLALAALAAGATLLVAFVLLEGRLGGRAMMPLHLFGTRSFVGVTFLTLFLYAALSGLFVLLPFLLIDVAGLLDDRCRCGAVAAAGGDGPRLARRRAAGRAHRRAPAADRRPRASPPPASRCSCASRSAGWTTRACCCRRSRSSPSASPSASRRSRRR